MKQIKCEMCGSTDLIKVDGVFVCQSCGTKYSVEEARKMMIEGTVDVSGSTLKIDNEDKIDNLYQLARRANESNNYELASKYYNEIIIERPNDWEANLYVLYYQTLNVKLIEIEKMTQTVLDSEGYLFNLVKEKDGSIKDEEESLLEVVLRLLSISDVLFGGIKKLADINNVGLLHSSVYNNSINICNIAYFAGDIIESLFGKEYSELIVKCYKKGVELQYNLVFRTGKPLSPFLNRRDYDYIKLYCEKIQTYDPSYQMMDVEVFEDHLENKPKGGCYVATSVYGSYDCPEVWTLRRYRDYKLSKTWFGRAFIYTYYAVSPTLVKLFGSKKWFKKIWKNKLDRMVNKLQAAGYDSTPYNDVEW